MTVRLHPGARAKRACYAPSPEPTKTMGSIVRAVLAFRAGVAVGLFVFDQFVCQRVGLAQPLRLRPGIDLTLARPLPHLLAEDRRRPHSRAGEDERVEHRSARL